MHDYPSSLRGSGHLRLVSFDTKGVYLLPAGSRSLHKNAARLDFHGLQDLGYKQAEAGLAG